MARLGEIICDKVAELIAAITTPAIKAVHRNPFGVADINSMPCAFVWLESADGARLSPADDKKRWLFSVGVAIVATSKSSTSGDITATLDGFRAAVENKFDTNRTLGGTCNCANTEAWSYVYEPGGDDGGMICMAATTVLAQIQATRQAN